MHKIYFDDRCIVITGKDERAALAGSCTDPVFFSATEAAQALKKGLFCGPAYLMADNPEAAYRDFCCEFKEVDAAGGLVSDDEGRCLLIKRNSIWDLPKGHREAGEEMERTAVREVEEETGLEGLVAAKRICITDHCYYRNGICHLKHTWWYSMTYSGNDVTSPQIEEGISEAVWLSKTDLQEALSGTYPSIVEVFQNAFAV